MYRWRDTTGSHKYCMACLIVKSGIKSVDELNDEYTESLKTTVESAASIVQPVILETKETDENTSMEDFEKPNVTIERLGETPRGGAKASVKKTK